MSATPTDPSKAKTMTVWSVIALGIGSMVGAGIFALLGQVAVAVRGQTWLAFALGGAVALLSGYSYARLSSRYSGSGGITEFFRRGLPSRTLAVALSLLYLMTLALTIAMVAKAFGAYAARVLHDPPTHAERVNFYATFIVVLLTLLNVVGAKAVGRAEVLLVGIKLAILAVLIAAGATKVDPGMLAMHGRVHPQSLLATVGLAFFAYAGYGMMANAAADVPNPRRTMPLAFFAAIGVTAVLYVTLALVVLGNVTPEQLNKYADTAVAEAAKPVLGHVGFVIVSVGALLATSSAINSTIFSGLSILADMGGRGELPRMFARKVWGQGTWGLFLSMAVVIAMTVFFNLNALANVASAAFLFCYLAVFWAAWRQRHEIEASGLLLLAGWAGMGTVVLAFLLGLWQSQPWGLALIAVFCVGSWLLARRAVARTG